ncbi:leucine rich repeat protein [Ichthyophthirius multifiliis]|uniref:Leucine rich repeat protein n=1 Tax=Ichthyophthirius multifiliis TaxID=5932 RepID=G0QWX6_ICHMU|nr:leucine rich repeat protein [Ichthyophthirius multifiliis]EGR30282.1 leucine rich repeat protein [Ichthyophthirius multifiliis]|eukprot:XP_004031869.1 leucine rich repeat protein [Ichthyophthirius multifiliis]
MGKPLTAELIKQKAKTEAIHLVKSLNLWGQEIDDLRVLSQMPNLEVLSLSVNQIDTLKDIKSCFKIKELYLRKNNISEISEIRHLVDLPELKVLWLCDNPCATIPNYREIIIKSLPNLEKLDNTPITQGEINQAQSIDIYFIGPKNDNQQIQIVMMKKGRLINKFKTRILQIINNMKIKLNGIFYFFYILINFFIYLFQLQNKNIYENENKNSNIVIAVLSLIKELDINSLEIVKRDIDRRLSNKTKKFHIYIQILQII